MCFYRLSKWCSTSTVILWSMVSLYRWVDSGHEKKCQYAFRCIYRVLYKVIAVLPCCFSSYGCSSTLSLSRSLSHSLSRSLSHSFFLSGCSCYSLLADIKSNKFIWSNRVLIALTFSYVQLISVLRWVLLSAVHEFVCYIFSCLWIQTLRLMLTWSPTQSCLRKMLMGK